MACAGPAAEFFGAVATSNGPVERVFNSLNQTDVPSRQSIGKETLHATLFLHGNWRAVEQLLLQRLADSCNAEASSEGAREQAAGKRMREAADEALRSVRARTAAAE